MIFKILALRCPKCGKGSLAAGLFKTADRCSACGMAFHKESGYFAGAIYPLYGMSAVLGGLVSMAAMLGFDLGIWQSVACGAAAVLLASPYLFWVSRSAFLHAEDRFFKRMGS
jgi:uncharacterized protein (DUF983 family)